MARRLLRLSQCWGVGGKIPLGKTGFREQLIDTGRLKLVPLGPRAVGVVEDEIDAIAEEYIAARDAELAANPPVPKSPRIRNEIPERRRSATQRRRRVA